MIKKGKATMEIDGESSPFVVHSDLPEFYFRLARDKYFVPITVKMPGSELELAKAAAKAGVPFTLATGSSTAMEKIANEAGGRLWFQLYMWADMEMSYELVNRAKAAAETALKLDDSLAEIQAARFELGLRTVFGARRVVTRGVCELRVAFQHLKNVLRIIFPVRRGMHVGAAFHPLHEQRNERGLQQAPLVMALLRPRVGEKHVHAVE